MARPLTPREATELIMALRRQQGDSPNSRQPSTRTAKRSESQSARNARRTSGAARDNPTEE
mgnify:CR=1 FL=1